MENYSELISANADIATNADLKALIGRVNTVEDAFDALEALIAEVKSAYEIIEF